MIHTKDSVVVFLNNLIKSLIGSEVYILNVWSDGSWSQFKNRFIAASLKRLEPINNIKLIWNFFATSPGKGPVDAIGGTVKRQVAARVFQRRAIVKDSITFYKCALEACSKINIYHFSSLQVKEETEKYEIVSLFQAAVNLPGISNAHQFQIIDCEIEMRCYSTASTPFTPQSQKSQP